MADIAIRQRSLTTFYIKVDPTDNVVVIVNDRGLTIGTCFPDGLTLVEHIPQGHKMALVDAPARGEIVCYGEMTGFTVRDIPQGSWINGSLVGLPTASPLNTLPLVTRVPEPLPPLEGYTSKGYHNADDNVGTKNLPGITTSVHCVTDVIDYMMKIIEHNLLPKYSNVDSVVGLNHLYGCGMAINVPAAVVPIRTIHNIAFNPNFGGEMVIISLGCEKLWPEHLLQGMEDVKSIPVNGADIVSLQDEKYVGSKSMADDILQIAEHHLMELSQCQREICPASELVVGMQCGGSGVFSGMAASPTVDYASDLLVHRGATVIFPEVAEACDTIDLLTSRAVNEEVGKHLLEEMAWYGNYLDMGKTDCSANPSPGNKKDSLTNVVERMLDSIAKSGKGAIVEVPFPDQRPTKRGLIYAVTPTSDSVCGTQQVALGITIQVFTTGRGTSYGPVAVPVIEIATRAELANRWYDLMDIDTGIITTGGETIEDVERRLFESILDVASECKKIFFDQWGLYNQLAAFSPTPVA